MTIAQSPWEVAKRKDKHFEAYLTNNNYFLAILPISEGANSIFKKIFDLNPSSRISLPKLHNEDPVTIASMPIKLDKTSPHDSACLHHSGISMQPALSSCGIAPSTVESSTLVVPDASASLMSAASSLVPMTPETHAAMVPVEIEDIPGIPENKSIVRKGHI
ncbi:Ran1-like protein kinase [Armillaria nabsnona]|nr:Ran1-like protein kinase [Armillaria nabsnona]